MIRFEPRGLTKVINLCFKSTREREREGERERESRGLTHLVELHYMANISRSPGLKESVNRGTRNGRHLKTWS